MTSQLPNVLQAILGGISLTLSAHGESANSIFGSLRENRLSWVSSAPLPFPELVEPGVRHIAYKDPSVVRAKDAWHVYASKVRHLSNGDTRYSLAYLGFPDWDSAGNARVVPLLADENLACAPQVFFFTPKKQWYVIYVWNDARTGYNGPAFSTLADVDRPETISPPQPCFPKIPDSLPGKKRWLDFTVIADSGKAYLFFTNDEGDFLRCHTALDAFPTGWSDPVVALSAPISVIFEGSQTYKIKDRSEYVTIVEGIGPEGCRYYNSYLADRLDGEWRSTGSTFEHPFAGCKNVTYPAGSEPWSVNISHGELIRASNDETMLLDLSRLEFLYQGWDRKTRIPGVLPGRFNGYHETPWKLGLLRVAGSTLVTPPNTQSGI